jgi:uncharacterized protein
MNFNNKFVTVKKSNIHGRGVFAKQNLKIGTKIIEYIGNKITKKEADIVFQETLQASEKDNNKGEVYLFELNKNYDINGDVPENNAKYMNHSCEPNCETEILDKKEIWITTIKEIKIGEELSFNYGFGIEEHKDYPCKCGTKSCIGYILDEDQWHKLNK